MSRRNPNHVHAGAGEESFNIYLAGRQVGCVFGAASGDDARAAWVKAKGPVDIIVTGICDPPPPGCELVLGPAHSTPAFERIHRARHVEAAHRRLYAAGWSTGEAGEWAPDGTRVWMVFCQRGGEKIMVRARTQGEAWAEAARLAGQTAQGAELTIPD